MLIALAAICLGSCAGSSDKKAAASVKMYLKQHLKKPESYQSISFSALDTLKDDSNASNKNETARYKITHSYSVINTDDDETVLTESFYLDRDMNVVRTGNNSINGDDGQVKGNATWNYNEYVQRKPDAGATVELYGLDSVIKYTATADDSGNYTIRKIVPGSYLLIVRSQNVTDCPEEHLKHLLVFADTIKKLFAFDIRNYQSSVATDSMYRFILSDTAGNKKAQSEAEKLLMLLPDSFKKKIQLNTAYSNAVDFSVITIEENEVKTIATDFGYTCI